MIFVQYLTQPDVNSVRIKPNVSSLLMGDYYCGVRKFWLSFIWSSRTKTYFLSPKVLPKWCSDSDHVPTIKSPIFLIKVCSHRKVKVQYCDKRSLLWELQLVMSLIFTYFNQFSSQQVIEFTATAFVFKWELVQHITAVSKLFWRCWFFTLETLHKIAPVYFSGTILPLKLSH